MTLRCGLSNHAPMSNVEQILTNAYPLHVAIYRRDEAHVRQIVEMSRLDPVNVETAYKVNSLFDTVSLLRKSGNVPLTKQQFESSGELTFCCEGTTPLELSIRESRVRIAEILIDSGIVNLNQPFNSYQPINDILLYGLTPLQGAIALESHAISSRLVKNPLVDVLKKEENIEAGTAAHFAAIRGDHFILEELNKRSENSLNKRNYVDNLPIHVALNHGNIDTAIFILKLPNYKLPTPTAQEELLLRPIVRKAMELDNAGLLKSILDNNSEIGSIFELDDKTCEVLETPLIDYAAANGKASCEAFLRAR